MTNLEAFLYVLSWVGKLIIAIYILDFMRTVKSEIRKIRELMENK